MSQALVFRSIASSNIPHGEKSLIQRMMGSRPKFGGIRKHHLRESAHALRTGGESVLVGGLLGATAAEVGLDIKGKIPVDLGLGLLAMGAAVKLAEESPDGFSVEARNIGASALTVFGFREAYALTAEMKRKSGGSAKPLKGTFGKSTMAGEFAGELPEYSEENDPILRRAHGY